MPRMPGWAGYQAYYRGLGRGGGGSYAPPRTRGLSNLPTGAGFDDTPPLWGDMPPSETQVVSGPPYVLGPMPPNYDPAGNLTGNAPRYTPEERRSARNTDASSGFFGWRTPWTPRGAITGYGTTNPSGIGGETTASPTFWGPGTGANYSDIPTGRAVDINGNPIFAPGAGSNFAAGWRNPLAGTPIYSASESNINRFGRNPQAGRPGSSGVAAMPGAARISMPGYFGANTQFGSGVGSAGAAFGYDQFGSALNSPASEYSSGSVGVTGSGGLGGVQQGVGVDPYEGRTGWQAAEASEAALQQAWADYTLRKAGASLGNATIQPGTNPSQRYGGKGGLPMTRRR